MPQPLKEHEKEPSRSVRQGAEIRMGRTAAYVMLQIVQLDDIVRTRDAHFFAEGIDSLQSPNITSTSYHSPECKKGGR